MACGSTVYEDTGTVVQMLVLGIPDVPVTRDQIRQIPYATIRAKIGNGQRSVLVLFRYDGSDLHWLSADRIALTTRAGRLVKSAGLPSDLRASSMVGDDPVAAGLHRLSGPTRATRLIDVEPGALYGIPVDLTITPEAEETIDIVERSYDVVRVRELADRRHLGARTQVAFADETAQPLDHLLQQRGRRLRVETEHHGVEGRFVRFCTGAATGTVHRATRLLCTW